MNDDEMKPEYDFTNAVRGKHFAGADPVFHVPVYLEQDVQTFLVEKATSKGIALDHLVNELLKRDIDALKLLG